MALSGFGTSKGSRFGSFAPQKKPEDPMKKQENQLFDESAGLWVVCGIAAFYGFGGTCIVDNISRMRDRTTNGWVIARKSIEGIPLEEGENASNTLGRKFYGTTENIYLDSSGKIKQTGYKCTYINTPEFYVQFSAWAYYNLFSTDLARVMSPTTPAAAKAMETLAAFAGVNYKNWQAGKSEPYNVAVGTDLKGAFETLAGVAFSSAQGAPFIYFLPGTNMSTAEANIWAPEFHPPTILNSAVSAGRKTPRRHKHRSAAPKQPEQVLDQPEEEDMNES